jgi:hypothetical protein
MTFHACADLFHLFPALVLAFFLLTNWLTGSNCPRVDGNPLIPGLITTNIMHFYLCILNVEINYLSLIPVLLLTTENLTQQIPWMSLQCRQGKVVL